MKVLPGPDYLEKHLPTLINNLEAGVKPTDEELAQAGLEIFRTFGLTILRNNGLFTELTMFQVKNVKFVTLVSLPVSPSQEDHNAKIHEMFEEKAGTKFDKNKHIVIHIPTNLIGNMIYGIYEIPEE